MGWKVSWIGVRGREKAEVLASLGLENSGSEGDFLNSEFSFVELPTGWMVFVSTIPDWARPDVVAQASSDAEAVGCQMHEGVNFSSACGFEQGVQKWSLVHYPDDDRILDVEGEPPAAFATIRDDLFRRQEDDDHVDYIFDVPVTLTAAICGFRPDMEMPDVSPETVFEHLQYIQPPRRPASPGPFAWLGRIFSGAN
jgi:hypothetical protein